MSAEPKLVAFAAAIVTLCFIPNCQSQNTGSAEERAYQLLAKMSLDEKVGQATRFLT
jgi:hypothetical protein